jgi:hypothetical protein
MSTSAIERDPAVVDVETNDVALKVILADGRELSVPIAWFPRLAAADAKERSHWRLIGAGVGIHWPDIDEDISVESLLRAN